MSKEEKDRTNSTPTQAGQTPPQDWAATPSGQKAVQDALDRGRRMAERLNESMRLDPKKLDKPFTR